MKLVLLFLLLQSPAPSVERQLLEIEHQRADDVTALLAALKSRNPVVQRLAVRTAGRLERASLKDAIVPLLRAADAGVRAEAANAMGQIRAAYDYGSLLREEKAGPVRAVLYETIGRVAPVPETETLLVAGLTDASAEARTGAAGGLESLFRLSNRTLKPAPATIDALRQAFRVNTAALFRELVLLTLNAAGDKDPRTFALAFGNPNPQVRRLAVLGSRQWIDDASPMVRYEAIRLAGTCDRAVSALRDGSELVVLAAIDFLGGHACAPASIEPLVKAGATWRIRAHALVSLARLAPDSARPLLPAMAADSIWQARTYAATAAKVLKDTETLAALAADKQPNVAAAAMTTSADAVRALSSDHAGLLLKAAQTLKSAPELPAAMPQVVAALKRLSGTGRATVRDPKMELLERVRDVGNPSAIVEIASLLADRDAAVAARAAEIINSKGPATPAVPKTTTYKPDPLPSAAAINALRGATARMVIKDVGTFTIQLLTEDAPLTVAAFAELADNGQYNGTTFHRFVANFVIQGGSPGADEMDGATAQFLRDEVGLVRHLRGTLGISTRGHDTGDGQIFVNLVDNVRLDDQYTVFARVIEGMDVVDRVLEGDVITSITIQRKK
ncbi:MAG TPA: peptidylprolyl isomerase [Vicinamibacterales bacterium]|nr:peptidylprolyl isomerase [Vicinamibacterales bacterium]